VPRTSTGSSSLRDGSPPTGGVPHRPTEIADRLALLGVVPSRALGQSFLCDEFTADAEAALVELPRGAPVVEVGGGLGLLTEALLRRGLGPITVIERDRRLAAHLRRVFGERVRVTLGDALRVELGEPAAVVGNLPFSVATPILTRLFEARVPRVVALLQKEVGERYVARPGGRSYGRPAIQASLYGEMERFAVVPAQKFYPEPAVDGLIVRFTARPGPLPVSSPARCEALVRQVFGRRRKQLGNILPAVVGGRARAELLASKAAWPVGWPRQRPEELPPEAYFALANLIEERPR
jgi:16S rRNA (adenine1518-N6/adenine1519-N6)-dimethyltransferase